MRLELVEKSSLVAWQTDSYSEDIQVSLMMPALLSTAFPKDTAQHGGCLRYDTENPRTGGSSTGITLQYQTDVLGKQGILCGWDFNTYPPYDDVPEPDQRGAVGRWLLNFAIGAAITVLFAGAGLMTGGVASTIFWGMAFGAAVSTCQIAATDATSGNVRSTEKAVRQTANCALTGGVIAATPLLAKKVVWPFLKIAGRYLLLEKVKNAIFPKNTGQAHESSKGEMTGTDSLIPSSSDDSSSSEESSSE